MNLRIARGFSLPLDVAGEAVALLGKRGSGKTNTGRVLAEELVAAGVQTVVLDPVGAWWGLRSIGSLRTLGLIAYPGPGLVAALPVLMLEGE